MTTKHLIVLLQVLYRHRLRFSFHCRFRVLVAFECGMFGYCCVSLLNACLTTRQTGCSRLPHYHSSQHPLFPDTTHCVHRLALIAAAFVVVLGEFFFSHLYLSSVVRLCVYSSCSLTSICIRLTCAPRSIGHQCPMHIGKRIFIILLDVLCKLCVKQTSG